METRHIASSVSPFARFPPKQSMKSKILLTLALAGAAVAQVTVNGPIQTGIDGACFAGKVVLERPAITNGGVYYGGYRRELSVSCGVVSLSLVPNVGSLPAGTSYKVTYYPSTGFGSTGSYTRYWVVPASGPITIGAIETSTPPGRALLLLPSQVSLVSSVQGDCYQVSADLTLVAVSCIASPTTWATAATTWAGTSANWSTY